MGQTFCNLIDHHVILPVLRFMVRGLLSPRLNLQDSGEKWMNGFRLHTDCGKTAQYNDSQSRQYLWS
ncbi:hypothetical protein MK131_15555 [Candidatus Poribacteria bacterium]|nr:hypothetical protein [Candidatus Poribacteria bacterium]